MPMYRRSARLRVPAASLEGSGTLAVSRDGGSCWGSLPLRARSVFQLSHHVNGSSIQKVTFLSHWSAFEPRGRRTLFLSAPADGGQEAEAHGVGLASPEPWALSEWAPCPGQVTQVDPTAVHTPTASPPAPWAALAFFTHVV